MVDVPTALQSWVDLLCRYSNDLSRLRGMKRTLDSARREVTTRNAAPIPFVHKVVQRLPREVLQQVVADYESGMPTTELMTRYGLGKGTVLAILERAGVQMRGQGLAKKDVQRVIDAYAEGWSLARVGAQFGFDAETVRKTLLNEGVTPRKSWERPT